MKKLLLPLFMMLLPLLARAYDARISLIYYNLNADAKTAEVTSGDTKYSGSVTIPASITYFNVTYSVTSIGESAFKNCSGLTSVEIPNSVTSIGNNAFYYCSGLKSINIPYGVTSIGGYAFSDCSGLTSVEIPNSVTSIGESAFKNCSGLTAVHISDIAAWCNISFTTDSSNPLYYAKHLYLNGEEIKELVIPDGVKSIGDRAFSGCTGLTSIEIPNSVTSIGDLAFCGCSGLTSIEIPNSVTRIGEYNQEIKGVTNVEVIPVSA